MRHLVQLISCSVLFKDLCHTRPVKHNGLKTRAEFGSAVQDSNQETPSCMLRAGER